MHRLGNPAYNKSALAAHVILEREGFEIRGRRATCPYCGPQHTRRSLTVAIHGELFFCHRCHRGGSVRTLGRKQGIALPAPRVRLADRPKAEFRAWLSAKYGEMADLEYRLRRKAALAHIALGYFPDFAPAWNALAELYHHEHQLSVFFESACDKIGRYGMYRHWRRAHAG
jgi:hypothetical protein